jgi:NADH dehydrogenase FAD-containing subunit
MSESQREILVVGSGPGALEATLALSRSELIDAHVSLISPQTEFVYRPNLVVEPFGGAAPASYSVAAIIEHPDVSQWLGTIERVDAENKTAWSPEGDEFKYDAIVLATGTATEATLESPAVTLGGPDTMDQLRAVVADIDAGTLRNLVFAAPDGPTWLLPMYELAFMASERAARTSSQQVLIAIVTPEESPLAAFGAENSLTVARMAEQLGVVVHLGAAVTGFDGATMTLSDGGAYPVDRLVSGALLRGRVPAGVPVNKEGFVPVDAHQRVPGASGMFAVGDVTSFRFKQGGLASEQADAAVEAIEQDLGARESAAPFPGIVQGILLTAGGRTPLRAQVTADTAESLPAEPLEGPAQKIFSRLLPDRLHSLDAGG